MSGEDKIFRIVISGNLIFKVISGEDKIFRILFMIMKIFRS